MSDINTINKILAMAKAIKEAHTTKKAVVMIGDTPIIVKKIFPDDCIIADFIPALNNFDLFSDLESVLTDNDVSMYISNYFTRQEVTHE